MRSEKNLICRNAGFFAALAAKKWSGTGVGQTPLPATLISPHDFRLKTPVVSEDTGFAFILTLAIFGVPGHFAKPAPAAIGYENPITGYQRVD